MSILYSTPSKGEAFSVQLNVSVHHFIREGSLLFQKQIRFPVDERDILQYLNSISHMQLINY